MREKMQEFLVRTSCGRNFVWNHYDKESCLRAVKARGYIVESIRRYQT